MAETTCQWWALCGRPAAGCLTHPTLGLVPCCEPCRDRVYQFVGTAHPHYKWVAFGTPDLTGPVIAAGAYVDESR